MAFVVATDFSAEAQRASVIAADMAVRAGLGLHVVHVSMDPRAPFVLGTVEEHLLQAERTALADAASALRANHKIQVDAEFCAAPVAEAVIAAAERVVATAIVVAAHRQSGPRFGKGISETLVQESRVPVLVVHAPHAFEAWLRGDRPLSVLVGSDLGAASTRALRFAGELARIGPVEITLACVAAPNEASSRLGLPLTSDGAALSHAAEAVLRKDLAMQAQRAGITIARIIVHPGVAAPQMHLSVLAENERADLLIVGTRKHSWIERVWAGSVAQGIVRGAPTNIACVPRSLVEDKPVVPGSPRVIIAATDLSPLGDSAVPLAYALVTDGGRVHLVHVVDAGPFPYRDERAHRAELVTRLEERIPLEANQKCVRTEVHVLFGRTADELIKCIEREGADAICVGSHGRSGLGAALLGSVSREVIAMSRCPVIVVPTPRE